MLVVRPTDEKVEAGASRNRQLVGVTVGLVAFVIGLVVALLVGGSLPITTWLKADFEAQLSLSLLSYSVMVLGVGIAFASYRRSRAAAWLSCLVAGYLITSATMLAPSWFEVLPFPGQYAEYGWPLGWMIVLPHGMFTVESWAFTLDVLIWSSIITAIAILISTSRSEGAIVGSRLAFRVLLSIILGGLLTFSSWLVWRGLMCGDALLCGFPTLGRGFPLPWMREFSLPRIPPYLGGVETQVLYSNLAFDLAVWSWFSFVAILVGATQRHERVERPISSRSWILGILPGLITVVAGLIVALVVSPPPSDYPLTSLHSLPTLGYAIMALGLAMVIVTYRKAGPFQWTTYLSAGTLITLATSFIQQSVVLPSVGNFAEHGFPLAWLTIAGVGRLHTEQLLTLSSVTEWAFVMDVLIWGSILAVPLVMVSASRFRTARV
jgi:hypothetical protein